MHAWTWPCKGHIRHINNTRGKPWSPSPPPMWSVLAGRWNGARTGVRGRRNIHISFPAASQWGCSSSPRLVSLEGATVEGGETGGSLAGRPCLLCAASLDKLKSCKSSSRLRVCKSHSAAPSVRWGSLRILFLTASSYTPPTTRKPPPPPHPATVWIERDRRTERQRNQKTHPCVDRTVETVTTGLNQTDFGFMELQQTTANKL